MVIQLYLILVAYFIIGLIITIIVSQKKSSTEKRKNWLKFITYLLIVNFIFGSIVLDNGSFHYISILIMLFAYYEIIKLSYTKNKLYIGLISLTFLSVFFIFFFKFSLLDQKLLLYTYFMVTVFDAFSQLSGQLMGKRKILPGISPNKTLEGLIGGFVFTIITSVLIRALIDIDIFQAIVFGFGLASFAFLGDVSASLIKRKFGVKDFSKLLPGQGGFLDRFDSLILSSVFMYFVSLFFEL